MTAVKASEIARNYAIIVGGIVGLGLTASRIAVANRQSSAAVTQAEVAKRAHNGHIERSDDGAR